MSRIFRGKYLGKTGLILNCLLGHISFSLRKTQSPWSVDFNSLFCTASYRVTL